MKILLLGQNGYLGSYLYDKLNVDVLPKKEFEYDGKKYDYVINCIGKPNLEYCEENEKETNYSNYGIIEDIINFYPKSKIINFSSYYVYDDEGFCHENSKVSQKYNYCKQKLKSEQLVKNGVSFRVGKLFGQKDISKQNKLTEHILKNTEVNLDDIKFNPTSLHQILTTIEYELKNNKLNGVYNLSNDGFTTHYEYGVYINKLLGNTKKINKVSNIGKTFNNYGKFLMDCTKIKKHINLTPWEIDVKYYIDSL